LLWLSIIFESGNVFRKMIMKQVESQESIMRSERKRGLRIFAALVITLAAICILSEIAAAVFKSENISSAVYPGAAIFLVVGMMQFLHRGYWHLYNFIRTLIRGALLYLLLICIRSLLLHRLGPVNVYEVGMTWMVALAGADSVLVVIHGWLAAIGLMTKRSVRNHVL
jgi:hypothetical protein